MENNFPFMLTFVVSVTSLTVRRNNTPNASDSLPLYLDVLDVKRTNPPKVYLCKSLRAASRRPQRDSLYSSKSVLATVVWQCLEVNFRLNLHFLKCVIPVSLS